MVDTYQLKNLIKKQFLHFIRKRFFTSTVM